MPRPLAESTLRWIAKLLEREAARAPTNGAPFDSATFRKNVEHALRKSRAAGFRCAYCDSTLRVRARPPDREWVVSLDHRQPLSRGGNHAPSNLAIACRGCNTTKGRMTEPEYRALLKDVPRRSEEFRFLLENARTGRNFQVPLKKRIDSVSWEALATGFGGRDAHDFM